MCKQQYNTNTYLHIYIYIYIYIYITVREMPLQTQKHICHRPLTRRSGCVRTRTCSLCMCVCVCVCEREREPGVMCALRVCMSALLECLQESARVLNGLKLARIKNQCNLAILVMTRQCLNCASENSCVNCAACSSLVDRGDV